MPAELSGTDSGLDIQTEHEGDTYVVRLAGELDLSGCDAVDQALVEAAESDAPRIILDIDGLEFVDSHGLRVLLRAQKREIEKGLDRLRVTRGQGHVAELLRITAVDQTLRFI